MENTINSNELQDQLCLDLGQEVKALFSMHNPSEVAEHLWEIYSGFTSFDHDCGFNPRRVELYLTFRDIMLFCERTKQKIQTSEAA